VGRDYRNGLLGKVEHPALHFGLIPCVPEVNRAVPCSIHIDRDYHGGGDIDRDYHGGGKGGGAF